MNSFLRYILWTVAFVMSSCWTMANTPFVGRVVDDKKEPITFASVYPEKNPQAGTVTDQDGVFVLDSVALNETVVVSFIGYRTVEIRLKKIPADTLQITLQEQPILLAEAEVSKNKKYVSKRRQKKNLLADVYSQLMHDFPDRNHFYKVVSDYAIYNEDQIAAFEELAGNIIEIPGAGKKGRDSIQLQPEWVKRYRHPNTHQRLSGIEDQLRKNKNAQRIQLVDSSAFVHRVQWGGEIKGMFKELKGEVSNWESYEKDDMLLLTFNESRNFLGIIKVNVTINLVLDPYSYRIRKQSQSVVIQANIPFGYKLNADQLAILNTVNLTSDDIERFRLKKVFADVKRNIIYSEVDNEVFVEEKNIVTKIRMLDNKERELKFHQTGHMKVLSASSSGVVPYTKSQLKRSYPLTIQ